MEQSNVATVSNNTNNSSSYGDQMDIYSTEVSAVEISIYVILATLGFLIIAINGLVIYLVMTRVYLNTVTNFCLASLAISDMFSGLCAIPLIITCSTILSLDTCMAMDLIQRFLSISTVLHLFLITIERYLTIVQSVMCTTSVMTKKTCLAVLLVVWTLSLFTSLIQLSFINPEADKPGESQIIYDFICLGLLAVLPLIIMSVAYVHIFYTLRKHVDRIKREVSHLSSQCMERNARKERKALVIYGAMICVFVVGWFNYFFNSLQEDLGNRTGIPFWADVILLFLRFATSLLNPLLYTFLKQDFRRARKSLEFFGSKRRKFRRATFTSSFSTRKSYLSSVSSAESQV